MHRRLTYLITLGGCLLLAACSSPVPELIKKAPEGDVQVREVQQKSDSFNGTQIRWGGAILGVENMQHETLVEVLSYPLYSNGKPDADKQNLGRFKLALTGFVDPEGFPKNRLITVTGKVREMAKGMVDAYKYSYPVVDSQVFYIWPEEVEYPYYYDPFYHPWYPYWYPYPYHRYR